MSDGGCKNEYFFVSSISVMESGTERNAERRNEEERKLKRPPFMSLSVNRNHEL